MNRPTKAGFLGGLGDIAQTKPRFEAYTRGKNLFKDENQSFLIRFEKIHHLFLMGSKENIQIMFF